MKTTVWRGQGYGCGLSRSKIAEMVRQLDEGKSLTLPEQVELLETIVALQDQRILLRAEARKAREDLAAMQESPQ